MARNMIPVESFSSRNKFATAHEKIDLPQSAEYLWPELTYRFTGNKLKVDYKTVQKSLRLDICRVQFAVTKDLTGTNLTLGKKNISLYVHGHCLNVTMNNLEMNGDQALHYFEDIFANEIVNFILISEMDVKQTPDICKRIKQYRPVTLQTNKAAAYYAPETKNFYFVGEVKKLSNELGLASSDEILFPPVLPPRPRSVKLDQKTILLLEYLGFQSVINQKYSGLDIQITPSPHEVRFCSSETIDMNSEVELFITGLACSQVSMTYPLCAKLFMDDDRSPNASVHAYLSKELKNENKKYHNAPFFIWYENDQCHVYGSNTQITEAMAKIVKRCIVQKSECCVKSSSGWDFLESKKKHRKLVYQRMSKDKVSFCCTDDILSDVLAEANKSPIGSNQKKLFLSPMVVELLKSNEKEIISSFRSAENITVSFSNSEITLQANSGVLTDECINDIQEKLKTLTRLVKVTVPKEYIKKHEHAIGGELEKRDCKWQIRQNIEPEDPLVNCDYLVCWNDPITNVNVNLVKGCPWHINFDLQIVFIDDGSVPIETNKFETKAELMFVEKCLSDFNGQNNGCSLLLGESTVPYKNIKELGQNFTVGLVVQKSSHFANFQKNTINEEQMGQGIQKVFKKCTEERFEVKTMGISASVDDLNIVANTIKAVLTEEKSAAEIDLFICCYERENQIIETLNALFRNRRGLLKKLYVDNSSGLAKKVQTTQVTVEMMSIVDAKVDAIVNTTRPDLDIEYGEVSRQILAKVGQSLKDSIKKDYKNGIPKDGVAISEVNQKKVHFRYIYHIALPYYEYQTFRKEVKKYVKKCLCLAERSGCVTIAFPAFGVGNLKYPRRETAAAMFEAVYEYIEESVDLRLKKVCFVVYKGDTQTCKAFQDEEWRHSKLCEKETGVTMHLVKKEYEAFQTDLYNKTLKIKVTTKEKMGLPPSYAIQVGFEKGDVGYKDSASVQKSWNARYICSSIKDIESLEFDLTKCIEDLKAERPTLLVIYTTRETNLPISDQASAIKKVLETNRPDKLMEVVIVVDDESGLSNASHQLNAVTVTGKGKTCDPTVSVELVGKTTDKIDEAEQYVKSFMKKIHEDNLQRIYRQSIGGLSIGLVSHEPGYESLEEHETVEVSAELNRGIVNYLEQSNQIDDWLKKINKKFGIKTEKNENDEKVMAKGTIDSMLDFEQYLEKCFPEDPDNLTVFSNDDSSYTRLEEIKDTSYESLGEEDIAEVLEAEDEKYSVAGVIVKLQFGNVFSTVSQCLLILCDERSFNSEILKIILSTTKDDDGETIFKACEMSVATQGFPKPNEDRRICTYLKKTIVLLVNFTGFEGSMENKGCLVELLRRKAGENMESVTLLLPGLGEIEGCNVDDNTCAVFYAQAIQEFAEESKCSQHITLVIYNENRLDKFKSIFDSRFKSANNSQQTEDATKGEYSLKKYMQELSSDGINVGNSSSNLFVDIGKINTVLADALVCFTDLKMQYIDGSGKDIEQAGSELYREELSKQIQQQSNVKNIFTFLCPDNSLRCRYVMFVALAFDEEARLNGDDIGQSIVRIIDDVNRLNLNTVAIPILQTSSIESKTQTCKGMLKGILKGCRTNDNVKKKLNIRLVTTDDAALPILSQMIKAMFGVAV